MQRIAFRLRVKPEKLDEYLTIHQDVWPELLDDLRSAGFRNYSIFADGPDLFAYLETDDWEAAQAAMANSEVNHRWQAWMNDYLDAPADAEGNRPTTFMPLIFHTD